MASLITAQYNLKEIASFHEQANKFVHSKKEKKKSSNKKGEEKKYVFSAN